MKERLLALDALRGIAALGIALFWHYSHFLPNQEVLFPCWFSFHGWLLVDFFFVLSGFIFSYVYLEKIRTKKISFKEFITSRIARLYPLYFITLCFVSAMQAINFFLTESFFVYALNDVPHFLLSLCMLFGSNFSFNGPAWSISCEMGAYILFFATLFYFSKSRIPIYVAIITTALTLGYFNTEWMRALIGFFVGCIAFELRSKMKPFWLLILSIMLAIFFKDVGKKAILLYSFLLFPSLILTVLNSKILSSILSIKPLVFLGTISYSIYLWHFPLQLTINVLDNLLTLKLNYLSPTFFATYALTLCAVATLSHHLLEKPAMHLKNKLLSRKTAIDFKQKYE